MNLTLFLVYALGTENNSRGIARIVQLNENANVTASELDRLLWQTVVVRR